MHLPTPFTAASLLLLAAGTAHATTPSPGCNKPLPAGLSTSSTNSLTFTTASGSARTYRLHLPSAYSASVAHPLIFSFHGRGQSAKYQEDLTGLSTSKFNPHGIVVYPQGLEGSQGVRVWQGDPDAAGFDDVGFTLELARNVSETLCVDLDRWYSSGKSNGGGFTVNILACDATASTKFAAFAGVASADYQPLDGTCHPDTVAIPCSPGRKGVPIFENHGTGDDTIDYDGGERRSRCLPTIPHFMTAWAERDGYSGANASTSSYDGVDGLTRFTWGNGKNVHLRADGLGHVWPSKSGNAEGTADYDVTPYIMDFFTANPLK